MIKQYIDLFFGAWRKAITLISKPLGGVVLFGLVLAGGFAIAFWQRDVGYNNAEIKYKADIKEMKNTNSQLIRDNKTLQLKLDNYDCMSEIQKYIVLYQNLKDYVTSKNRIDSEINSLQKEKQKTIEIEKSLKAL